MARYDVFKQLTELTKMSKMEDRGRYGYQKMIQRGQLSFHDYNHGFFDFMIWHEESPTYGHYVRLWVATIDDGDFGGCKPMKSKESACKLIDLLVEKIFKNMIAFPSDDELNDMLIKYGVTVGYE